MSDGMEIPFEADLAPLQAAIDQAVAAFERMAATISSAFTRANAAIAASAAKMGAISAGAATAAGAQQQMASSTSTLSARLSAATSTAGNLGNAFTGASAALRMASSASRVLTGVNLAASLTGWISRAGGIRAAFSQIPAAMRTVASNPVFKKVVIGAALAVGGVLALRTAFRAVTGAFNLAKNTITGTFRAIVSAARSAASKVSSAFRGMAAAPGRLMGSLGGALPFAGLIGGLGGLAAAATFAVSSINKAAQMETLETAFAPLLGGADAAKARIAELAAFAAATPFQLPEIAQGSRVLETLTRGALATGKGLTLVGDVAAGTGKPFDELAMWIGRLYDGLQSGRPVGEALMRLQELGVVSGDVRGRIEALQKSGAAGAAIWAEAAGALGRFSGSMERQSVTWSGKLSTLKDEIGAVMVLFGRPIIDGLKPYLDAVIEKVKSLQSAAKAAGEKIKDALDTLVAAWQTDSMFALIGNGLEMAILNGINTFVAGLKGGMAFLSYAMPKLMKSVSEMLFNSGLMGVFKNLFNGLGSIISAAIMSSIGKVSGWKGWELDAENERKSADYSFSVAKFGMENLDLAGSAKAFSVDFWDELAKSQKVFQDAKGTPFLDDSGAAQKFIEGLAATRDRKRQNQEDNDAAAIDRDAKLKNRPFDAPAILDKAIAAAPSVTSLGRIGGGGFGSFSPMIGEQRKTNGILGRIEKSLSSRKSIPVIA